MTTTTTKIASTMLTTWPTTTKKNAARLAKPKRTMDVDFSSKRISAVKNSPMKYQGLMKLLAIGSQFRS